MLVKVCLFSAKHPPVHLKVTSGAAVQMLMRCPRPLLCLEALGDLDRVCRPSAIWGREGEVYKMRKKSKFMFLCQEGLQESQMTQAKRERLVNEKQQQQNSSRTTRKHN